MKNIIGIMAATSQGLIGSKGKLPWNYPDELDHFKSTTLNHTVIMGGKTYDSTPKSFFKNRNALVLSRRRQNLEDATIFNTIEEMLDYISSIGEDSKIFMIGGGEVTKLFLEKNLICSFLLTKIHKNYIGDTYMDLADLKDWKEEEIKKTSNYTIFLLTQNK